MIECDNCGAMMKRNELEKRWECRLCGQVIEDKCSDEESYRGYFG